MITTMIRIIPSDMAPSKANRAARRKARRATRQTKHIPCLGTNDEAGRSPHERKRRAGLSPGIAFAYPSYELSGSARLVLQRRRVDAVAQARRSRSVIEDVAEMARAFRAQHLGADHAVRDVVRLVDMALNGGLGETRPAAAGVELGI